MFKKVKFLSERPKLSLVVLLLFALVFTTTGVYLIYHSLASDVYDIVDGTVTIPTDKEVLRVWGNDRYSTAVGVSQKIFTSDYADCVVVTYGESWPDAAVASSLAGACNGPILLAKRDSVSAETANEIKRLRPKKIYMVGGTAVLYTSLENSLKQMVSGVVVKRVYGADRYLTSVEVAKEIASLKGGVVPDRTIFVVTGTNFPDALTVGSVSALKGYPVIYVSTDLPSAAASFIKNYGITRSIVIGGTAAVNTTTYGKLPGPIRITGADRYQTSYNFALYAVRNISGVTVTNIGVAYGGNYPDALTSGPFLAKSGKSVLMLDDYKTKGYVSKLIGSYRSSINKIYIIGGPAAISSSNYLTYANNMGSDYTYKQVKSQELLDTYVRYCPMLAGTTVDYGNAQGYRAIAYPRSARIVISPTGIDKDHPLSLLVWHEIHHVYDERDGDTNPWVAYQGRANWDWGEQIPRTATQEPRCLTNAHNAVGYVYEY